MPRLIVEFKAEVPESENIFDISKFLAVFSERLKSIGDTFKLSEIGVF
jgi:hypothetical protein